MNTDPSWLLIACTAFFSSIATLDAADRPRPPNLILILADDLGGSDLACYGHRLHETPSLDRLAARGVRFTQAYAAAPVCSPTRACLLTGKSPARLGMTHIIQYQPKPNSAWQEPENRSELPLAETTLFEALKRQDYATAHIGKWHLGGLKDENAAGDPRRQGADINVAGSEYGQPPDYFFPFSRRVGEQSYRLKLAPPSRDGSYLDEQLTAAAGQFIEDHADRPFFLFLSFFLPHTSMGNRLQAKSEKIAKYQAKLKLDQPHEKAVYAAMIEHLDDCVGRITKQLDDLNLTNDTFIVFTSDNGGYGDKTDNAPLRDAKSSGYEGGLRVPAIFSWPTRLSSGKTSSLTITSADLFPTFLAAAGAKPDEPTVLDGVNLLPYLTTGEVPRREALYWHYPHFSPRAFSAIRSGRWKLIEFFEPQGLRCELYDLDSDPSEQHDASTEQPELVQKMKSQLNDWRATVGARMPIRIGGQ